jgi:tRNA(Ile)-lysidine synthase
LAKKEITLEQRVLHYIQKRSLFSPGVTLLVAVSGGADSVCLLHLMLQLHKELDVKLQVAHLNHKLRGEESDDDAWYVVDLAHRLGVPVTMDTRDITAYRERRRCSLEEAAREVRYNFLAEAARKSGASCVLVGHTRDDQVETILMHIIRGTGIAGLRGLQDRATLRPGENGSPLAVVRPLLEVARQETVDYCRRSKLEPRNDSSNESHVFLRNRIRLELLPVLRNYNPQIDAAVLRLAAIAADQVSYIEAQASTLWNEIAQTEGSTVYLDKKEMLKLLPTMQRHLFRMAIEQLAGNLRDIEADHIEAMLNLLSSPAGKSLCLPHDLKLLVEYGRLILTFTGTSSCPFPLLENEISLTIPGETLLPGWKVTVGIGKKIVSADTNGENNFTASFDLDKTGKQLLVRARKRGDRFQPLGMKQTKKLQDFMVDARIPRTWRCRVPLLCSPQQILWVVGWRIDNRVKVTEATKKVLNITFEKAAHDCGF